MQSPWQEIAWWVKQVADSDPYHTFHVIEGDDHWVIRAYGKERHRLDKEPIIIANIIFWPDAIELYHIQSMGSIEIDIQDQDFLEKIVAWLYEWNIQLDQDKLKEMQCKVEPPSHHGLY